MSYVYAGYGVTVVVLAAYAASLIGRHRALRRTVSDQLALADSREQATSGVGE